MKKVVLPCVTLNRVRRPIQRNLGAVANTKTQKTVETPVDEKVDEEQFTTEIPVDVKVDEEPTAVITDDVKVDEEPTTETPVDVKVDEDENQKKTRKKKEKA